MVSVFLLCLPSQIAEVIQNAWDCACGGDAGVNARHGLRAFPSVGVVMAFIFTPEKPEIALLSSYTSQKAFLANLFPGWSPSHLGILGQLRMFHGICLVSHVLSLLPLALTGSSARIFLSNTGGNLIPRTYFNLL